MYLSKMRGGCQLIGYNNNNQICKRVTTIYVGTGLDCVTVTIKR